MLLSGTQKPSTWAETIHFNYLFAMEYICITNISILKKYHYSRNTPQEEEGKANNFFPSLSNQEIWGGKQQNLLSLALIAAARKATEF